MKTFNRNALPDGMRSYRRVITNVTAARIDGPFSVDTREGTLECPNWWCAIDVNGDPYPIADDVFKKLYAYDEENSVQNEQLTPHFSLAELTVTTTGLDNYPDPTHRAALQNLANQLEVIRDEVFGGKPITVHSAYRSASVNEAVGGVPNSAHTQGHAVDFTCDEFGEPLKCAHAIQSWAEEKHIEFDQLIHEENVWVHYSPQNTEYGQRRQYLTYDGATYTVGIHAV